MKKPVISKGTFIFCGIAILYGLISYWFYSSFTKVKSISDIGYSEEAKKNKFLAAELYLKAKNIQVEQVNHYNIFSQNDNNDDDGTTQLERYDTVFINSSRVGLSTDMRNKIRQWVSSGGHLIAVATEFYNYDLQASRDKLLDDLGLRYYQQNVEDNNYQESEKLTRLSFDGYQQSSDILFNSGGYIEDTSGEAVFTAGPAYADHIIQYELEKGLVTVVTDFSIWSNQRINQYDHAILLTQLIGDMNKVWLIYNRFQPGLLTVAFIQIPMIVISVIILLSLMIFSGLWRRGAIHDDVPAIQREIMQHIAAAGEFSFRVDKGQLLIAKMRQSLNLKIEHLVYGYSKLSTQKQIGKLSQITSIKQSELEVLWSTQENTNESFVNKTRLIQKIRKHL